MNEYALVEFVLGTFVLLFGVACMIFAQPAIAILLGIPLVCVSLLAFYLGCLCLDK